MTKRAIALLLPIIATVACAEREKEVPPPPATTTAQASNSHPPLPKGLLVKKPLNIDKVDNVGLPALPQASVSASASASAPSSAK
jgi:hypothetical protein